MPKKAVFERSRRELSLDVSFGIGTLLIVEKSSLESQSRGWAKTPILAMIEITLPRSSLFIFFHFNNLSLYIFYRM